MRNFPFVDWERVVHERDTVLLTLVALDFVDCVYRRLRVPNEDRAPVVRALRNDSDRDTGRSNSMVGSTVRGSS